MNLFRGSLNFAKSETTIAQKENPAADLEMFWRELTGFAEKVGLDKFHVAVLTIAAGLASVFQSQFHNERH